MFIFQTNSSNTDLYQYVKAWMEEKYGVDVKLGVQGSYANIDKGNLVLSNKSKETIFHESMHMWLFKTQGLAVNSEMHKNLSNTISSVFDLEQNLSQDSKSIMEKIFGKPEYYSDVHLNRTPKNSAEELLGLSGYSHLGNLVDESSTLSRASTGHPMKNFHEFFASSMTTMAFGSIDGNLKNLAELEKLGKRFDLSKDEIDKIELICSNLNSVLKNVYNLGKTLISDFESYGKVPVEINNLKTNLSKLENYLIKEGIVSRKVEKIVL